jgi:tetratricopeptide (TPR) repeat protein
MLQNGAANNAVSYLNQSLALDKQSSQTYFILGAVFESMKDFSKAEINFNKSIELYPEYTEAYFGLAKTFFDQQKIEESNYYVNKCLILNPSYQQAKQLQDQLAPMLSK